MNFFLKLTIIEKYSFEEKVDIVVKKLIDTEQYMTWKLDMHSQNSHMVVAIMYAKYTKIES